MNRKNRKKRGTRGAVTVFLTMVLVPCLIFTCAFGDISRVKLSKAQAESAADLALYSVMSNFDEELQEWYGMVASVQNINEFYSKTADYFKGMMDANGLDGTTSQIFTNYLRMLASDSGDITDFLKVDSFGDTNVTTAPNGELGKNPALIEDQIVEFMKYRGPVEIGEKVIDKLRSISGKLNDVDKDKPVVDAKQEAAEAQGKMLSELLYTYIACVKYEQYYAENEDKLKLDVVTDGYTGQPSHGYTEQLSHIKDDFKIITDVITKYYTFSGLTDMSGKIPTMNSNLDFVEDGVKVNMTRGRDALVTYSQINAEEDEEGRRSIDAGTLSSILSGYSGLISSIKSSAESIANALSGISVPDWSSVNHNKYSDDPANGVNPARYYAAVQQAMSNAGISTMLSNCDSLIKTYGKLALADYCILPAEDPNSTDTWSMKISTAKREIENLIVNYLSFDDGSTEFEKRMKEYRQTVSAEGRICRSNNTDTVFDNVNGRLFQIPFEYSMEGDSILRLGSYLEDLKTYFGDQPGNGQSGEKGKDGLVYALKQQLATLNAIIDGGTVTYDGAEYTTVSLDELDVLIRDYKTSRQKWGDEAQKAGTEFGDKQRKEFEGETSDVEKALQALDENSVPEFKARLTNIRTLYQTLLEALEGLTYGGTAFYGFTKESCITAAKSTVPENVSSVAQTLTENESAAQGYYNTLISPQNTAPYTPETPIQGARGNDPDIKNDPPALYYAMESNLNVEELKQITDNKNEADSDTGKCKDEQDRQKEAAKGVDMNYLNDLGDTLNAGHTKDGMDALDAFTGIVGVVSKIISGNFDEFRDQLYVVEYVMDMFSYSSYNNEGEYKLGKKDDVDLKLGNFNTEAEGKNKGFSLNCDDYVSRWCTDEGVSYFGVEMLTKYDNQSLTNRPINSSNNAANLAEVEYVLFGKSTVEENLKASYGGIFAIREVLNLVSAFQLFYGASTDTGVIFNTIAGSIMTLTCGIVPAPVTKCVLIGLISVLETAKDMQRMKAGIPVALYKSEEERWFYSLAPEKFASGKTDFANPENRKIGKALSALTQVGDAMEPVDEGGLYYSDYVYLFLALAANSADTYKGMLLRIGDLIEANMIKGGREGYDLDKAICYFQLKSTVNVKPLFITLPIATNQRYENADTQSAFDELSTNTDWCTYSVDMIRGYS